MTDKPQETIAEPIPDFANYMKQRGMSEFIKTMWDSEVHADPPYPVIHAGKMLTDVVEYDTGYNVIIDVPGASQSEISLFTQDNALHVEVKCEDSTHLDDGKYLLQERGEVVGKRSVRFPKAINHDTVRVIHKYGRLNIWIDFAPESDPITIPVKTVSEDS